MMGSCVTFSRRGAACRHQGVWLSGGAEQPAGVNDALVRLKRAYNRLLGYGAKGPQRTWRRSCGAI